MATCKRINECEDVFDGNCTGTDRSVICFDPESETVPDRYSWIPLDDEHLPPNDKRSYPIVDSDGCGDFILGTVIRSDFEDSKHDKEATCRIKMWINCPLPDGCA